MLMSLLLWGYLIATCNLIVKWVKKRVMKRQGKSGDI